MWEGGKAGSELRPGHGSRSAISPAFPHMAHGLILHVGVREPAGDFFFLILFLFFFSSFGLRTSFFWNGENESPRASSEESEAS